MKAFVRSQRRNSRQTGPGIALFPFLAVLICTMGAMVPLLMVITRTVRLQAEAAALAKVSEHAAELKTQQEDVRWRIKQLKRSRTKKEAELADARLELGHLEDHTRRLREKLARYQRMAAELKRLEKADDCRTAETRAKLSRLQTQINTAERLLAQAREEAAERRRSYAVVPYEGPNQTHRRPIYIECREDAIILQPEGITLTEADFDGPLGPGNPLAAALRAAREYMLDQRQFDPEAGEPYPMLLVRPGGINAYYAARMAMQSWAFDFGYELVGDDWNLAYPPADSRLTDVLQDVVASARVTQARLVAAAPRHYASRPKIVYRAAPRGGFVRETRPADDEDRRRGYVSAGVAEPIGRAQGPDSSGAGTSTSAAGTSGATFSGGNATDNGTAGGPYGSSYEGLGTVAKGDGAGSESATLSGDGIAGSESAGTAVRPNQSGTPVGTGGGNVAGGEKPAELPEGYVVGQPPREQKESDQTASADEQPGRALRPGEWEPAPERRSPKHGDMPGKMPDDRLADKPNDAFGGTPEVTFNDKHDDRQDKGLADKRGADWGLRDAASGSVGVTRLIPVACYADRLIVVCSGDPGGNRTIALGPRVATSIDTFISAVWEHMETWGIAGRGMYWRPLLQVYVAPGAEQRFAELSALLEGSGLMVRKKQETVAVGQ